MARHFPVNEASRASILVQSPHDLRTPKALADLEQMAQRVSQLPGIAAVRGITRPTGQTLEQAKTTYQAGEIGQKLDQASTDIASRDQDLDRLTGGAHQLAGALRDVRGGVLQAMSPVSGSADALVDMKKRFGGSTKLGEIDQTATSSPA